MSLFSRSMLRGSLAGLVVLIGAANGPAHAGLSNNALNFNGLMSNGLSNNALLANALVANALVANGVAASGLDDLNGVTIEAVIVPGDVAR